MYPELDRYRMIGASVTDLGWLEQVPADRPAVIVAERLLPYLEGSDVRRLLLRLTDRFGLGRAAVRRARSPADPAAWPLPLGIRDPRQIERWNPRLHLAARVPFATHFAWIAVRGYRVLYRVMNGIPVLRTMFHALRFTF